jgi:hypothetical protein
MTVIVRTVNLGKKRENVLDILNRNLQDVLPAFRFDWLYRNIRVDQPGRGSTAERKPER